MIKPLFPVCFRFLLALCLAMGIVTTSRVYGEDDSVQQRIRNAGNADDDAVRLEILKKLQKHPDLDETFRAELDRVVALADRWIHDPQLYRWFDREIRSTLDYDVGVAKDSSLYPITCIYRGRMLVWTTNEYGNIICIPEPRRRFFDAAVKQFRIAAKAFPENKIVRMYLGEPIPPANEYEAVPGAPEWAVQQREGLQRLHDIVLWWIDNRLGEDGQYGGGWDDDCEMWRSWVPVMIAFEDPKITEAQAFFSRALLSRKSMKDGYTTHLYDVEHTAEPSTDTITPMMHLAPDDAQWRDRAMRLAELMETIWTGRNERGFLQFKSTYFNATRIDKKTLRACDTPYHVVAIQPALVLWLRTGDEKLGRLFTDWLDTWVDATARAERGKPAGAIPAAIRWPGGEPAGPGKDWWDPRHHGEPTLYEWPSAVGKMTDTLLLAYHMTGDEKYLAPIRSMAAMRLEYLGSDKKESPQPGSRLWCGSKAGFIARTLEKYRLLTGSDEFDTLLDKGGHGPTSGEDDTNRPALGKSLGKTARALAINFPGRTSEVRFTDRVFAWARMFGDDMMFPKAVSPNNSRPNITLLYETATGDRGDFRVFPLNAVRWLTKPREIAALVTERGDDHFKAELFHFGKEPRPMGAELYLLKPGRYAFTLKDAGGKVIVGDEPFEVKDPRTRIGFTLPAQKRCILKVMPR